MKAAIEQERTRIAKDIHDDLGANLTQITMLSEMGETAVSDKAKSTQHFDRIACNYVCILKRVPKERLHSFERHFEEVLAYALILCLQAGFPDQSEAFKTPQFLGRVLDLCTEWVRGFRPSRTQKTARAPRMRASRAGVNSRPRTSGAWKASAMNRKTQT